MDFIYSDGRLVILGDSVETAGGRMGVVVDIAQPGDEAKGTYNSVLGGIAIEEKWPDGRRGNVFIEYDQGSDWRDIKLVRRC